MSHSPNLFPLKLLVISLGIILAGGIVFVLVTIWTRANSDLGAGRCVDATIHLANAGTLTGVTPQGATVQLTINSGGVSKVLTVDRCTGTLLQTLSIAP